MNIQQDKKYLRSDGLITGEMKPFTDKDYWFDSKNEEIFNNDGFKLTKKKTFVTDKTLFLIHEDYSYLINTNKNKSIDELMEDIDNDNYDFGVENCPSETSRDYRKIIDKTGTHTLLEFIYIYHEFLDLSSPNYSNKGFEFLQKDIYNMSVYEVSKYAYDLYTEYVRLTTESNFEKVLSRRLEEYVFKITIKVPDLADMVREINAISGKVIEDQKHDVLTGNKAVFDTLGLTKENLGFVNIGQNVFADILQPASKREFDAEYYFDVSDKHFLINTLRRKIKHELNIKTTILYGQKATDKFKNCDDLDVLENVYKVLKNLYENSNVSDKPILMKVKTTKYLNNNGEI